MKKYRKKPVVVEAFKLGYEEPPKWYSGKPVYKNKGAEVYEVIDTLEGKMRANLGDYIVKGIKGEFYPVKPDIFEATYEECVE